MQNTNTTFSPFECGQTDTFEICSPHISVLPYTELPQNEFFTGNLIFIVILLIFLAFIRLQGNNIISQLLLLLFKRKKVELILSEEISHNLFYHVALLLFSTAIVTGFISLLMQETNLFTLSNIYLWGYLLLYHISLLWIFQLLGWTFNGKSIANECMINLWVFHVDFGIVLLPFLVVLLLAPHFSTTSVCEIALLTIGFLIITKIIRWIQILISHKVSILYMILYLCALEIAPLLILYKMVM